MVVRRLAALVVLVALAGCASKEPDSETGPNLERALTAPPSSGNWSMVEGPIEYSPDSLWEYLDGGAPRYEAYGFERLTHIRFQLGDDSLSSVTVDAYDMGSELGAFGIFRSIRPSDAMVRAWGAEGYRSGTVAAAWKGGFFLHAAADDERPELTGALEELVSRICSELNGETSLPPILDPLPSDHLVPFSERYVATDLLGHSMFPGGVLATYEVDGDRGELFFSELENETIALEALEGYRVEKKRWAEITEAPGGFRFQDPGSGSGTVLASGRYVVGVQGDLPFESQEELLGRLIDRLGS